MIIGLTCWKGIKFLINLKHKINADYDSKIKTTEKGTDNVDEKKNYLFSELNLV